MRFRKRSREFSIDVLVKTAQTIFAGLVIAPIVTEHVNIGIVRVGATAAFICILLGFLATLSYEE